MTEFGAIIPHVPGKPCPFPDAVGLVCWAYQGGQHWQESMPEPMRYWSAWGTHIIAYRLPADHHAYGPRVSRMGREPDRWANAYDNSEFIGLILDGRKEADFLASRQRSGVWRIYRKGASNG